jgi:hypothetical protein
MSISATSKISKQKRAGAEVFRPDETFNQSRARVTNQSVLSTGLIIRSHSAKSPIKELCPKEKEKLRYKQDLAREVIAALLRSSDNPLMKAQAARIEKCNSDGNSFVAEDLHTPDGELFEGKGTLWACNSRLCPNCTGKLSKRSRRILRFVMENQKLLAGEDWFSVTLTMPNLNLKNLPLPIIAEIMQTAWKRFSALETRADKKPTWFQKTIRGGFKNCEFTYTKNDVYNYHLHSLVVAKSKKIESNNFFEIRQQWTKALQFAFGKFGIDWECRTGNKNFIPALYSFLLSKPKMSLFLHAKNTTKFFGLVNVRVEEVNWTNREKTINELCKYVTKNESWSKIPIEQLETIVAVPRFWRMFESFGVCRQTARAMKEKTVKTSENADNEFVNQSANASKDAYLDTKNLINRQIEKVKRVSWRKRVYQIPFWQYEMELANEIAEVQRFRRQQLQKIFEFAQFQTLDGKVFSACR